MRVLVLGGDGFVGRHLVRALDAAGHEVTGGVRDCARFAALFPHHACLHFDFNTDDTADVWLPRLAGFDAVVNAAGLFRDTARDSLRAVHVDGPRALFAASVAAGVPRLIHISALGADAAAATPYHRSKRSAEETLETQPFDWIIVQPSLIYGSDGASARLFRTLAALPVIPLPGGGQQAVQPIHIEDAVAALCRLLEPAQPARRRIALVGPRPVTLRQWLADLREGLGLGRARFVSVPAALSRLAVGLAQHLPGSLITRDALSMLMRGNTADAAPVTALLGRVPRATTAFIDPAQRTAERRSAQHAWLEPLLRASLAFVWLASAAVSFGLYAVQDSYALLAQVGITGRAAAPTLYGAATLDLLLGVATLFGWGRPLLWQLQIWLIIAYSLIIAVWLPQFWLHPFGPMIKNVPMLAMLLWLREMDR